ncbi:MAG: hypothetical protein GY723_14640 [bacterium]|nr:hypothetical protein [bacterium]
MPEGLETIHDEGFSGWLVGTTGLEKQQGMPPEPLGMGGDGRRRDRLAASDLAVGGTGDEPLVDGTQRPRALQPVGEREGL